MPASHLPTKWRAGAACLLAGGLFLAGCNPDHADEAPPVNNAAEAPDQSALNLARAIPLPESDLDREDLLLAALRAASAHAAGKDDRKAQSGLAGRQFSFRIRFGCRGPAAEAEGEESAPSLSWSYEAEEERLKLRAAPDIDSEQPLVQAVAGEGFEAIQGFWIRRPWLLENACPARPLAQDASQPTLGIAHFFSEAGSRGRPRSREAYESVQRLAASALPGPAGFDLVLNGRLTALPDGRVIRCAAVETSARPVCLISAEFNRVSIENGATGVQLAEWGRG